MPDPIAEFDDYCAAVLLSSILIEGEASHLYQRLVKTDRLASHVSGDVGLVAGTFEVRGPSMLHLAAWYPGAPDPDRILAAIDEEVSRVADGVEAEELDRFRSSYIADYLGSVDALSQRGMLIAAFEQQRANAGLINEIPSALARVQADDVARMARAWLQPDRRAVLDVHPGANA